MEKEVHVCGGGIHGYLVFSTQFCCEPKISLKKKSSLLKLHSLDGTVFDY